MNDPTGHKLSERVKELSALHRTARLIQDEELSCEELLQKVLALLPPAWQYPEVTEARIHILGYDFSTSNYRPTEWMQTAPIRLKNGEEGTISVIYREPRPNEAEGPFLVEERDLIDSLAEMLRSYFHHRLADQALHESHENLERLVANRTAALRHEIEEHRRTQEKIEQHQDQLRRMATELSLAEARERRAIAAELHDHIGQEFAFLKMRIQQLKGDAIFSGFDENLSEIVTLIDRAIQFTRKLTFEISTPILYELGFVAALQWLAESTFLKHRLPVRVIVKGTEPSLAEPIRITLFKAVQELITNVIKHAKARAVRIEVATIADKVIVTVSDDGCGFVVPDEQRSDSEITSFGLFSIRERLRSLGGSVTIQSEPGAGTVVTLSITKQEQV
ncbi:MAG: sensor histidine kinase [bacterium]|nr:sensor histidine kinase [bacterium]